MSSRSNTKKKVQTKLTTTALVTKSQDTEMSEDNNSSGMNNSISESKDTTARVEESDDKTMEVDDGANESSESGDASDKNSTASEPGTEDKQDQQKHDSQSSNDGNLEGKEDVDMKEEEQSDSNAIKRKANRITAEASESNHKVADTTDNVSYASSRTSRPTKKHHFHDSDDEHSWYDPSITSEDDANTINSNETSKFHKGNQTKVVLPKFTRYQMMILLDQDQNQTSADNLAEEQDKTPSQRVREFLAQLTEKIYEYDKDAQVMTWKTESNFNYMSKDQFPDDVGEVAKYFQGFRNNFKVDKRVYLRIAIHTPNSQSKLYSSLNAWMGVYGYTFSKCIIQAESSTCIGWLAYSSQYTDTEVIKSRLAELSPFEWGFKMISITKEDENVSWLKRARAMGIYVPTPMKDVAINIVGEQFEASLDSQVNVPDFTDKFLFMEPESAYKGSKARQIYYKKIVDRHIVHTESIVPELSYGIKVDLDAEFIFQSEDKSTYAVTLRDIILDLKVQTKENPLYGTSLFHSVDYFAESDNLWINGQKYDGGSCCVFTYYEDVSVEASTMSRGMGRMVAKEFDVETASMMFTRQHFQGSKGYRWNKSIRKFSTPQVRQMLSNQQNDHNLPAIKVLQKKKQEQKEAKEKEQLEAKRINDQQVADLVAKGQQLESALKQIEKHGGTHDFEDDSSTDSNLTEQLRATTLADNVKKQHDRDLDSLGSDKKAHNRRQKLRY